MKNQPYHKATFEERCKADKGCLIVLLIIVVAAALIESL